MKKLLFILNPCAGTKRANRYLADILAVFNRAGYQVEIYITGRRGDAAQVAAERGGQQDLVVCCGGDGTYNETISGLLGAGLTVPVGYIPAGSTNDFASSLKLPLNPVRAAKAIVSGSPTFYDVGKFGSRYFSYVASFGAFTKTSYATPQNVKNALGHTAYVLEGIQELTQLRSVPVRLEMDDRVVEDNFLFGAVCNSTSIGGILTLDSKQVDMSDGLFEVFLVRKPKDLASLHECIWAVQKQQYNCQAITFCSTKHLKITMNPDIIWTLDGEQAQGSGEICIENLHNAISLQK